MTTSSVTLTIIEGPGESITVCGLEPADVNRYVPQLLAMTPRPGIALELVGEAEPDDAPELDDDFFRRARPGGIPAIPIDVRETRPDADIAAELAKIATYVDIFTDTVAYTPALGSVILVEEECQCGARECVLCCGVAPAFSEGLADA